MMPFAKGFSIQHKCLALGKLWVADRYVHVRELPLGIALSTIALMAGVLAVMTGIIFYTIANVSRRLQ